jgi:hypothetical protein
MKERHRFEALELVVDRRARKQDFERNIVAKKSTDRERGRGFVGAFDCCLAAPAGQNAWAARSQGVAMASGEQC